MHHPAIAHKCHAHTVSWDPYDIQHLGPLTNPAGVKATGLRLPIARDLIPPMAETLWRARSEKAAGFVHGSGRGIHGTSCDHGETKLGRSPEPSGTIPEFEITARRRRTARNIRFERHSLAATPKRKRT